MNFAETLNLAAEESRQAQQTAALEHVKLEIQAQAREGHMSTVVFRNLPKYNTESVYVLVPPYTDMKTLAASLRALGLEVWESYPGCMRIDWSRK